MCDAFVAMALLKPNSLETEPKFFAQCLGFDRRGGGGKVVSARPWRYRGGGGCVAVVRPDVDSALIEA